MGTASKREAGADLPTTPLLHNGVLVTVPILGNLVREVATSTPRRPTC